jgi:pimeloyl-ACP methyl ester carboxylesterase
VTQQTRGATDVVPAPDPAATPSGFVVEAEAGTRIHFLDWGGPAVSSGAPRVLLVHGLGQTAWTWTAVARRLSRVARVIAMDLRGHGLSDSPTQGYDPDSFVVDLVAVAEGSGLSGPDPAGIGEGGPPGPGESAARHVRPGPLVLAGHGFGAIAASWAAARLGHEIAGLVLIDGGWQDIEESTGVSPGEFLRELDEPPEVLRTMDAFLADRRAFDPDSWDADQERAARETVVETHAGRLTPATRPHVIRACVDAMFGYRPAMVLPQVTARIGVLSAADDADGASGAALAAAQRSLAAAGRPPMSVIAFPDAGHNLPRYRPEAVARVILAITGTLRP